MDLKKITTIATLLLVAACSERDLEYYAANIDDAEKKAKQCEASMTAAYSDRDENKLKELSEDTECNSAVKAFGDHERKLARMEREERKRKAAEERAAEEKIYQEKYAEKLVALKAVPYADFFALNKSCGARFLSKKTPECGAYTDLRDEVELRETNALTEKYSDGKLEVFRDQSCKGVEYDEAFCYLAKKAARKQNVERVDYYVANREELKTEFNKCHATYTALRKAKKWQESNDAIRTYQCDVVGKAARKLQVYSFNKPIG